MPNIELDEIVVTGRLVDASNATLFGNLITDEEFKVIYKPIAGERPLWDFPDKSLASRELATYRLSEFLSLNLVPLTVLRDGPYGFGMVQKWMTDAQPKELISVGQSDHPDLRKMVFFDYLINNADRKFGHILMATGGNLLGCDHGVTFHVENKLRTVLWQFAGMSITKDEESMLKMLLEGNLLDLFAGLLSEDEIAALSKRAQELLEIRKLPNPPTDRPAIPWPPV